MFTGLVEGQGTVQQLHPEEAGIRLTVEIPNHMLLADESHPATMIGDSVAINGCCLTVIAMQGNLWDFQAGSETLSRTNLGQLKSGSPVNLERALSAHARLGGHFVQGHVDGQGLVHAIEPEGEWMKIWFTIPTELSRFLVSKGSITVDGISLTLVDVGEDFFSVALIPHTLQQTTLGIRQVGDPVNLETDILGKYIDKMLTPYINRLHTS